MNRDMLLAHIDERIRRRSSEEDAARLPAWLRSPEKCADAAQFGVAVGESEAFEFDAWLATANPAFGGRAPCEVIDGGTPAERARLALAIDAIAALQDGAFS